LITVTPAYWKGFSGRFAEKCMHGWMVIKTRLGRQLCKVEMLSPEKKMVPVHRECSLTDSGMPERTHRCPGRKKVGLTLRKPVKFLSASRGAVMESLSPGAARFGG
jgi:hypothetical protein